METRTLEKAIALARFDAHLRGLQKLVGLGVTWAHTSLPGDSLAHALETLEQYGETVIAPSRA